MATYASARAAGIASIDELDQAAIDGNAGPVTGTVVKLSDQLASVAALEAQVVALEAKLAAGRNAANVANAATQAVIDALA
jgi:hypothetical protein